MVRRRIGQEDLIARSEPRLASSLSELAAVLDWREIDRHLAGILAAAKGDPGWPPLALFRALLLATWHDLSDVRLAEAFFATLECELLDRRRFRSQAEARIAVFHFIEGFYNATRRHSALGYLSPAEYEARNMAMKD